MSTTQKIHAKIEKLNKSLSRGIISADAFAQEIEQLIASGAVQMRIVKTFGNGIRHVEYLDRAGRVICDRHETAEVAKAGHN